jgi:thioredoxin-like negative regulator of GroEL
MTGLERCLELNALKEAARRASDDDRKRFELALDLFAEGRVLTALDAWIQAKETRGLREGETSR